MRWGMCGASTIGAEHMIKAFREQAAGQVAWVVSGSKSHVQAYAGTHQIARWGASLDDMLAEPTIDAVYISSTNEKHFAQALAAIAAGKHVLCEKPLAMSVDLAADMVAAAAAKRVIFATNHHQRCSGSHKAIRALIAEGRIGRVLSMRIHHAVYLPPHLQGWRVNDAAAGGGVIPDITAHDADTARFLLDESPVSVVATAASSGMGAGVEDSVMSIWTMPSGAMVMAHESFTHAFAGSGLEVHGTKGSIFAQGVMTQAPVGEIAIVTAKGREAVPYADHDLYAESVRQFEAAVTGQCTPSATGHDGVASLAIALAVREAALTGRRVSLTYEAA